MTRNDANAVVKLLIGPKLRPTTLKLLDEHQTAAMAAGDKHLVTAIGNAMEAIGKLDKAETSAPSEPATLPANNEPEPERGSRRNRS